MQEFRLFDVVVAVVVVGVVALVVVCVAAVVVGCCFGCDPEFVRLRLS